MLASARARAQGYVIASGLDPSGRAFSLMTTFLDRYENPGTLRRYGLSAGRYCGWAVARGLDPLAAKRSDADLYEKHMNTVEYIPRGSTMPKKLAPNTRAFELGAVRAFYAMLVADGEITFSPFAHIKVSGKPINGTPAFVLEELQRVMDAIAPDGRGNAFDQRDYALLLIGSRVGPRRKELRGLCWRDVKTSARGDRLNIVERKGGKRDEIDLPADVRPVLMAWKAQLAELIGRPVRDDEPVLPCIGPGYADLHAARRGRLIPMGLGQITIVCRDRFAAVGLVGPRFATHSLRATAVTIGFEHGATIEELMIMGGWTSEATCWNYIKRLNRPSPASYWVLGAKPFPAASAVPGPSDSPAASTPSIPESEPRSAGGHAQGAELIRRAAAFLPSFGRRVPGIAADGVS